MLLKIFHAPVCLFFICAPSFSSHENKAKINFLSEHCYSLITEPFQKNTLLYSRCSKQFKKALCVKWLVKTNQSINKIIVNKQQLIYISTSFFLTIATIAFTVRYRKELKTLIVENNNTDHDNSLEGQAKSELKSVQRNPGQHTSLRTTQLNSAHSTRPNSGSSTSQHQASQAIQDGNKKDRVINKAISKNSEERRLQGTGGTNKPDEKSSPYDTYSSLLFYGSDIVLAIRNNKSEQDILDAMKSDLVIKNRKNPRIQSLHCPNLYMPYQNIQNQTQEDLKKEYYKTVLHWAMEKEYFKLAKALIVDQGFDLSKNLSATSFIFEAIFHSEPEILFECVSRGATQWVCEENHYSDPHQYAKIRLKQICANKIEIGDKKLKAYKVLKILEQFDYDKTNLNLVLKSGYNQNFFSEILDKKEIDPKEIKKYRMT